MNIISCLKKGIAAVSVFALSLAVSPMVSAGVEDFSDYAAIPSWAHSAIDELMAQGVVQGNTNGTFAPSRTLNRAEVSKIMVLATGVELDTDGGSSYSDVNTGDWFYDYVETMTNYGWINGYPDGSFGPGNHINRAELAKMVVNSFEMDYDTTGAPHFEDVLADAWYYNYVETAYNNGLMVGFADGTFGPNGDVTRAETVKIVYDAQILVAGPTGTAEGTLSVELSPETPNGTNIPYNATSVPFQTIELTASDDADVEISSITITRLGLGDNDDFDNVWLEIDGFKVGNDKSINNDDIAELRFNPPIVVPAGQTLVADVVASLEEADPATSNVGSHNRFAVVSADDIASTAANVSGDFPIEGEEMEIASYEVSEVSMSTLGSDTTIDVGDNFIEIGKFRLLNETSSNKDIELRAMTFKNDGSAQLAEVLENVALYVSGEQVSAETIIDGDYITFRLDNGVTGGYVIEDGDSRIFSIRADIVSAEDGDNINFKVDNYEDIVAVEIGTFFGVKAISSDAAATSFSGGGTSDTGTSCGDADAEDDCARLRAYEIDSGDLNVSRDPASLGSQQYAPGSNDVVVLTARLIVDQPIIVDGVTLRVGAGTDANGITAGAGTLAELNNAFDNFRLFLNDSLVDSENNFAGTDVSDARLAFNTTFEIAGTSILKLVTNIKNGAGTGSQLKVTLDAGDFDSPEYISTGDQISDDELLGSAEGSFVEVTQSEISISKTDGLSDGETIVAGVNDVTFLKFVLDNNDSGDVNVTSVSINTNEETALSGNTREFQNFTAAIFSDGVQQGSSKNLSSVGVATFNDLSVIIPSAGQKEFTVVVNTIESSASVINFADGAATGDALTAAGVIAGDILVQADNSEYTVVAGDVGAGAVESAAVIALVAGDHYVKHTIRFDVTAVDVDNVENGQTVDVENGAQLLSASKLEGAEFEMVQSGTLTLSNRDISAFDKVAVANSDEIEVAQINFNASNDDIEVKDIYLVNDLDGNVTVAPTPAEQRIGQRVDFMLYNEAGQLVQTKQMTDGVLHFELANNDRISVPKDGRTFVTIKMDVRNLTNASETGARVKLALDSDATQQVTEGIEAVTAATGSDIAVPTTGWGEIAATGTNSTVIADSDFVVARTKLAFAHAAANADLTLTTTAAGTEQGIYRFQVTADSAYDATLERVSFEISPSLSSLATITEANLRMYEYGNSAYTGNPTLQTGDATFGTAGWSDLTGVFAFQFAATEEINAGETRYYEIKTEDAVSIQTNTKNSINAKVVGSDDDATTAVSTNVRATALGTDLVAAAANNRIIWSDRSNDGNPGAYLNGYGLVVPSATDGAEE